MRALSGLNAEQKRAVEIADRHLLVVAGAGSGKTRVLTHKISHLIEDLGVHPSSILAMTFSNRAAREMSERVGFLLPSFDRPRWVGTFHSLALRILKEFASEAGLSPHFSIYDESDQLTVIKRALTDLGLDPKRTPPKLIRHYLDLAKNETEEFEDYLSGRDVLPPQGIEVVRRYTALLKENQALDFGDLLGKVVGLTKARPEVGQVLKNRFKRILIDEYQDTNRIQKELIRRLAGPETLVTAVGDEDQSIYSWRGARVENILEFEEDFPGAEIVKLEQNYRSTKKILAVANHIISKNVGRREKRLWTENDEGETVEFGQLDNDHGEAAFVADRIQSLVAAHTVSPTGIAVFYRTNVQSRVIEEEFLRRRMDYRVYGGVRFYDRAEVKDALAFLKLALNPLDTLSFGRIVNTPSRGIGDKTLEKLFALAAEQNGSPLDAISGSESASKAQKALVTFAEWFRPFSTEAPKMKSHEALEEALNRSGYYDYLEKEHTIEAESRMENLNELLRSMEEFHEAQPDAKTAQYLDAVSLISDMDNYSEKREAVTLMTAHNSKGLEFPVVFVVGLEEGIFPHHRSLDEGDEGEKDNVEEERRLLYVAMTRARKKLFLTAARTRRVYQSVQQNPVSRFVGEIPASLLLDSSEASPDGRKLRISTFDTYGANRTLRRFRERDEYRQETYDEDDAPSNRVWRKAALKAQLQGPYPPGCRVKHPSFGLGTVRKCDGKGEDLKLTVEFQRHGRKVLALRHTQLELVDQ